jgi:hypothetical protein
LKVNSRINSEITDLDIACRLVADSDPRIYFGEFPHYGDPIWIVKKDSPEILSHKASYSHN